MDGTSTMRLEDERLLTGKGRFIADLRLPGEVHAVVIRSPHAHATLRAIRAPACPGLLAVLTADDVAADGLGGIPGEVAPPGVTTAEGDPAVAAPQMLLAAGRVRYVGEPVALWWQSGWPRPATLPRRRVWSAMRRG